MSKIPNVCKRCGILLTSAFESGGSIERDDLRDPDLDDGGIGTWSDRQTTQGERREGRGYFVCGTTP